MKHCVAIFSLIFALVAVAGSRAQRATAADSDSSAASGSDDLVGTIATLLADKDKDVRALGLQQVRDAAKGAKATQQFAALLPKLSPEAQIGLLDALADRGDKAARPAVVELLKNSDAREFAMRRSAPVGSLGEPADIHALVAAAFGPGSRRTSCRSRSLRACPGRPSIRRSPPSLPVGRTKFSPS